MVNSKFNLLLEEIEQFNTVSSLQNTDNYLKIVNNSLYNELRKNSIEGSYITNPVLQRFLDIAMIKISEQVLDTTFETLTSRLNKE